MERVKNWRHNDRNLLTLRITTPEVDMEIVGIFDIVADKDDTSKYV